MDEQQLVDIWRRVIVDEHKSWVVFAHGTCVVLTEPAGDLGEQATAIRAEYGPVHAGSPAGDFGTLKLHAAPGWVVTAHHPVVGLTGRGNRDRDGRELQVIHVEDRSR